ncbi:ABC transporter permease [Streptomyces profundus]|uniref:ABC transporter permease n=1 Tax=Streptomyces profundus TaxID=2867410 RepID=UPI001D1649D8|nr:ABC transporter permease [Streptomyces sp. MA3_2.13]UED87892.1 ABC transporter permease [Streptomyces sp. MA3_2.13]
MRALRGGAKALLFQLGLPAVLIGLWWLLAARSTNFYYPTLDEILSAFRETWFSDRFVDDILPSLGRLLAGYLGAVVIGVGLGVLLGSRRRLRALLEPVLEFFRAVPPPVLIPVLMLFSGIGDTMKIVVIITGAVWPVLLNTVEGVRAIDDVLADTARCYGLAGPARLRRLVLPAASPQIVAGMRQALSISIILMVIGEMFASSSGLGFAIVQFQRSFAIPEMWSGILLLGLLGFGLSLLFGLFESRVLRWHRGLRQSQRGEK